jgi:integrase
MTGLKLYQRWATSELETVRVSERSAWNDDIWAFRGSTAGQRPSVSTINWKISLPDGSLLTDPQHGQLLEAWKRVIWCLFAEPGDGRQRKWETLGAIFLGMRYLTRWMVERRLKEFSTLTPPVVKDYLDDLAANKRSGDGDDGLCMSSFARYIQVLRYIWWARHDLALQGLPSMMEDPLGGRSVGAVTIQLATKASTSIRALQDDEFLAIVNSAWEYIEKNATVLVKANSKISTFRDTSRERRERHIAKVADGVGHGLTGPMLSKQIEQLRTVCSIIIQASTGMRVSELVGLEVDRFVGDQRLPDCVEVERTEDDYYELFFLRGWCFKGIKGREESRWVAGLRPAGSDYLPPPVRAAQILAALDDGWRRWTGRKELYLCLGCSGTGFPISPRKIARTATSTALRRQKEWIRDSVGLKGGFSTHMWRKTFAQYMVRSAPGMLPVISDHFKHLSQAMTEQGYLKARAGDKELNDLVRAERSRFAAQVLHEIATGEQPIVGPKAEWLRQEVGAILKRLSNRPLEGHSADIEEIVRENHFKLWDSDWGYCVFAAEGARCHRKNGVLGAWARRTPNFAERSPPRCVECPHFAVAPDHEPFWRRRLEESRARWEACKGDQKTSPIIAAQFRERVRQAEIVLTWIEKEKHHAA